MSIKTYLHGQIGLIELSGCFDAYAGQPAGRIASTIAVAANPPRLLVELCDAGRVFDPSAVPAPNLEEAQVHGGCSWSTA
jgi:hypothetical protein